MTLGSGLAIFGIWGAVAVSAVFIGEPTMVVALFAAVATAVIAGCN